VIRSECSASKCTSVFVLLLISIAIDLLLTQNSMASDQNQVKLEVQTDTVADAVYLSTVSYGCTRSTDFSFRKDDNGHITAMRLTPDRCRRKAFTVTFHYSLAEVCRAIQTATVDTPAIVEGIRIKR